MATSNQPTNNLKRILVIGAHPDDCEFKAAGVAQLWRQSGFDVRFVSVTDGSAGHHQTFGDELVSIRRKEAAAAARVLDVQHDVLQFRDGHLLPSLESRNQMIALIRKYQPDLVLTHRPNDYHPDHRYTSQLVCDAAYMVTVPAIVPDVPALRENPVIAYLSDHFEKPNPFCPTIVVDIEPVFDGVIDSLDCHRSQFYEWLAYNLKFEDDLPAESSQQREWLKEWMVRIIEPLADKYRDRLTNIYGATRAQQIRLVEAFEPCEYGSPMTAEKERELFPFLPKHGD